VETTSETTVDAISGGALEIAQHRDGYRFGLDSLLLATDLPALPEGGRVVDLGAAQGAVGLCIANRRSDLAVVCVERQPQLAGLLGENVEHNGLSDRVDLVECDLRSFRDHLDAHSADLVVCNPPYYRHGQRRPSENAERASAHHELHGTLADFVRAAAYVLDQRGWLKVIIPPVRLSDLLDAAEQTDLSAHTLRFFHSRAHDDAYLLEALFRRGGAPDTRIRAPLYIYQNADDYSDEVQSRIHRAALPEDDAP
jgi:tRNA1Val (adenine37-N6)-methyltransferase